jgi:hypothetical protein
MQDPPQIAGVLYARSKTHQKLLKGWPSGISKVGPRGFDEFGCFRTNFFINKKGRFVIKVVVVRKWSKGSNHENLSDGNPEKQG